LFSSYLFNVKLYTISCVWATVLLVVQHRVLGLLYQAKHPLVAVVAALACSIHISGLFSRAKENKNSNTHLIFTVHLLVIQLFFTYSTSSLTKVLFQHCLTVFSGFSIWHWICKIQEEVTLFRFQRLPRQALQFASSHRSYSGFSLLS
jgi:hypothetical protein